MGGSGPSKNGEEKTWKPSVRASMGPLLTTPLLAQVALTNKREESDEGLARGSDDSDEGGVSDHLNLMYAKTVEQPETHPRKFDVP